MVPDATGRFAERPHYTLDELDQECERIVSAFLRTRRGDVQFPIATDDLRVLIEHHDASLDAYADLSAHGDDVEGVTEFTPEGTEVSICARLANDSRRENRLRTTLSHEFGHVHFHRPLWAAKFVPGRLFERGSLDNKIICKRDAILNASQFDWMEWQAGYISGAILIPASHVRRLVTEYCQPRGLHGGVYVGSDNGRALIGAVMDQFDVSEDAARIRLLKLNLLATSDRQLSLFG